MRLSRVKKNMVTAVCISLSVVLELTARIVPDSSGFYGLLHLPVLICALVCGGGHGAVCGLFAPLFSAVAAGTPSVAMLPVCVVECVLLGFTAGAFTKKIKRSALYIGALAAMVVGRMGGCLVGAFLFADGTAVGIAWGMGYFSAALPGAVVQFVLVPYIMRALEDAGLLHKEEAKDE